VTYGSGGVALYGVDAIGGTINQITLNPTIAPQVILRQSFGDQGRLSTTFQASGTSESSVEYSYTVSKERTAYFRRPHLPKPARFRTAL